MKINYTSQHKNLEKIGGIAFLLVILSQSVLRPYYGYHNDALTLFFGFAPNLFGAIGLAIANFIFNRKTFNTGTKIILAGTSAIGILGLWEVFLSKTGKSFDYDDIIATVVGALIGMIATKLLVKNEPAIQTQE